MAVTQRAPVAVMVLHDRVAAVVPRDQVAVAGEGHGNEHFHE